MGSPLYDAWWGSILKVTTKTHTVVYRLTKGKVWRRFPGGAQVVWIRSLGRKSGVWRHTPLLSVPDGDDWIVTGSNAGQEKMPGWVYNVRSEPSGYLEVDGKHWRASFTEITGSDRDELYGRLAKVWSAYRMYEQNTTREIPVFRISRVEEVSADSLPGS